MTIRYAMVFPGQGSQSPGMLSAMAEQYPVVKETYQEASEILGFDLWQLVQQGPEDQLNSTENTQPALLTGSVALWKIWQTVMETPPVCMAGHSLGEYSALVCAGSIEFSDAVSLVAKRGQYMQEAIARGEGSMAAILGLDDEKIINICNKISADAIVSAANFNSPGQVVIAGQTAAVEKAVVLAKEEGAKRCVILPVSVPSHCALMKPAADRLQETLNSIEIQMPAIPVIHNVDGNTQPGSDEIRIALINQLHQPVQWTRCVQLVASLEINLLLECGPGKVLSGLTRRIDRNLECYPLGEPVELDKAVKIFKEEINDA